MGPGYGRRRQSGFIELLQRSHRLEAKWGCLASPAGALRGSPQMKRRAYLLLSLFAAASGWLYTVRTLSPWGEYRNEIRDQIRSQMGDLYPRWLGTQELLLRGRNPYGPEVSHEIQKAFYGHAVSQDYSQPGRKVDEQRFAYPLYVVFLLAPTVHS